MRTINCLILLCLLVWGSAFAQSNLPACPSWGYFHICFGTYTHADGGKYAGAFKDTGVETHLNADVVATAKRDPKPGELIDGEGGYTLWGKLLPAATYKKMGGLPSGLAHGVKVVRPVAKGQSLSWEEVAMDTMTQAYKIRREIEAGFSF